MLDIVFICIGLLLFLAGFYTGVWIQRHSYHIREVPKMVTTEKLVEVEKPVVIQVPQQPKQTNAQLAIMGLKPPQSSILDPAQQAEAEKINDLLSQMPEL